MNKKIMALLIAVLTVTACACSNEGETSEVKDSPMASDYIRYKYGPLKKTSEAIVKVEVQDNLSEKNSVLEKDEEDPDTVAAFYAIRDVKVLEVYAGDLKADDSLKVIEGAAVGNNFYYHGEGYECLEKGKEYLLFLRKGGNDDEYSIISADNGAFCISDLNELNNRDDDNFEIAVKALVEFEGKCSDEEKANIIKAKVHKSDGEALDKEVEFDSGKLEYGYVDGGIAAKLVQ